jgi:hypothetical protein
VSVANQHINNGANKMDLLRFTLCRWLIHAGLRVMPHGPARRELTHIITMWGRHVIDTIDADFDPKRDM